VHPLATLSLTSLVEGGILLGGLFSRVVGAIDRSKKRRILFRPTVLNKTISEALCLSLRLAEWTISTKTSTRILNKKLP
jgi:hypothetical protein